jgi:hypothetical protein
VTQALTGLSGLSGVGAGSRQTWYLVDDTGANITDDADAELAARVAVGIQLFDLVDDGDAQLADDAGNTILAGLQLAS